jgi:hypothetical protein
MVGEPKLGRVVAGLVLAGLAVAGCEDPQPPQGRPKPEQHVGPAVFAFAGADTFRMYRDDRELAKVSLGQGAVVRDAEWTADGTRLVLATESRLFSIDTATGAVVEADCTCDSLAVAAGTVYVLDSYGGTRLTAYDAATLAPAGTTEPDIGAASGLLRVDGAGDRVVLFAITEEGARAITDVVVLDPDDGATTTVGSTGEIGMPTDAAFSSRGWRGAPTFAYVANGSTGASTGRDSVVWFDPTSDHPQTVTDSAPLRAKTPDIPDSEWNNRWDNLWWTAGGELRATGSTWSCAETQPLDPPVCTDRVAHTQWRFDGSDWREADDRGFTTRRDVGASSLELALAPSGVEDRELTLVHGTKRTVLGADVRAVWTPPRSVTKPDGDDRVPPDAVVRYAPLVWLSKGEENLPGAAEDFLSSAKLVWANDSCTDDTLAEPGEIDLDKLTTTNGYRHHATEPDPTAPPTDLRCVDTIPEWDTLDPTRPFDGAPESPPGHQGFVLDADNDLHPGAPLTDGASAAPVYYQYRERKYIYYWFFYPYNDAPGPTLVYPVPGGPPVPVIARAGHGFDHEGDWERVSVRLNAASNEPDAVVYSGHSHVCYRPWADVDKTDGHPLVYSAIGTHASYPTAGSHLLRHAKVKGRQLPVWDHTSEGATWRTWDHLADTERSAWFGYAGGWGEVGLTTDQTGPAGPSPNRKLDEVNTDTRCE